LETDSMISTETRFGSETDIIFKKQVRIGQWKSTIRSSLQRSWVVSIYDWCASVSWFCSHPSLWLSQ